MKKIITIMLTLIAVNSFAEKFPEAQSLHPELYTIQFTFAWFPTSDNVLMGDKKHKRAVEEYENLLEELEDEGDLEIEEREMAHALLYGKVMKKALINHIESCKEVEYKDIATIYTSSGEPFPEAYSNVKGLLDVESNTLVMFECNFPGYLSREIESSFAPFYVNEWYEGGGSWWGGKNNGYLFVKCYPPTNVSSNQTSENKD